MITVTLNEETRVLPLSLRTVARLSMLGVHTVGDLIDYPIRKLTDPRLVGNRASSELARLDFETTDNINFTLVIAEDRNPDTGLSSVLEEDLPLELLDISHTAYLALKKAGIDSIGALFAADSMPIKPVSKPAPIISDRTAEAEKSSDGDTLGEILRMQKSGEISVDEMVYYYEHPDEFTAFMQQKSVVSEPVQSISDPEIEADFYGVGDQVFDPEVPLYTETELEYSFDEPVAASCGTSDFTAAAIGISEDSFTKLTDAGIVSFEQLKTQDLSSLMMLMIDITDVYIIIDKCTDI